MDAGYVAAITGLIGALIGSASSIATILVQARMKDKRDRTKLLTDIAMSEFKMLLDRAASGQGPSKVVSFSTFLYHYDLVLKAVERGTYTPERAREIALLDNEMLKAVMEIDERRRGSVGTPS
jgi:hypothetical protein